MHLTFEAINIKCVMEFMGCFGRTLQAISNFTHKPPVLPTLLLKYTVNKCIHVLTVRMYTDIYVCMGALRPAREGWLFSSIYMEQ